MLIPFSIDDDEILVRFIFLDDFKNKKVQSDKIIPQEIFVDSRLAGISLQRAKYSTEVFCKEKAKNINGKVFTGFITFRKNDFTKAFEEYKQERNLFDARIEFTPLDKDNLYLIDRKNSTINDDGNPSHADLLYINPAMESSEPTPKTTLRLFSRRLFNYCEILIDSTPLEDTYSGDSFVTNY